MSLLKRASCGVPARRMALSSRCLRMPQPSRTARSTRWEGFITPDPNIESIGLRSPATRALSLAGVLCCATRGMEPSLARVKAFDWLRGLAVLVMIECHAMVLLRKELLASPAAAAMDWLNGLVAPSFIFAAGFSLALVQVRTARSGGSRTGRLLRTLRRIGEVLAVGTLINYVWFPIWVEPAWLLRVDILQCIGVTLLLALPLFSGLAARPRQLLIGSLAVAAAPFFVAPFAEGYRGPLQDWVNQTGPHHSVFPLLPWAGWVFLGGAAGAVAGSSELRQVRKLLVAIGATSVVVWLLQPLWLAIYPPHAFWVTDPANSAQRCVVVMLLLLALSAVEARAGAAFRASAPVRFIELFGTSSLAAYFFHEMLLYYQVRGVSLAGIAGGKSGWLGYALLTAAVIAVTAVLTALTDRIYRWLDGSRRPMPRPGPRVAPVGWGAAAGPGGV